MPLTGVVVFTGDGNFERLSVFPSSAQYKNKFLYATNDRSLWVSNQWYIWRFTKYPDWLPLNLSDVPDEYKNMIKTMELLF